MNVSSIHYTTKIRKMKIKISLLSLLVHQNLFALGQICTGNVDSRLLTQTVLGALIISLDDECFFELNLHYRFTMSCKHGDWWYPVEILQNGTIKQTENNFYGKNYTGDPTLQDFPAELYEPKEFEEKNCVFGNGEKTGMITINDQAPPAPLEVIEGALVHVKVNNNLGGGIATSLHFHGFKMDKERFILAY